MEGSTEEFTETIRQGGRDRSSLKVVEELGQCCEMFNQISKAENKGTVEKDWKKSWLKICHN